MAKTILIVDDDSDIQKVVSSVLKKEGYVVMTASNGDECLKMAKENKIDLILLDIMMPGTSVRTIVPKIKSTKIAYLSIVQTSEAEREYLLKQKNVVGFIQKPFEIKELVTSVNKILAK